MKSQLIITGSILFLTAIAILATSCGKKDAGEKNIEEKDAFTIKGKFLNETGSKTVELRVLDMNYVDPVVAEVNMVDGEFVFKSSVKEIVEKYGLTLYYVWENYARYCFP